MNNYTTYNSELRESISYKTNDNEEIQEVGTATDHIKIGDKVNVKPLISGVVISISNDSGQWTLTVKTLIWGIIPVTITIKENNLRNLFKRKHKQLDKPA